MHSDTLLSYQTKFELKGGDIFENSLLLFHMHGHMCVILAHMHTLVNGVRFSWRADVYYTCRCLTYASLCHRPAVGCVCVFIPVSVYVKHQVLAIVHLLKRFQKQENMSIFPPFNVYMHTYIHTPTVMLKHTHCLMYGAYGDYPSSWLSGSTCIADDMCIHIYMYGMPAFVCLIVVQLAYN